MLTAPSHSCFPHFFFFFKHIPPFSECLIFCIWICFFLWASLVAQLLKNLPAMQEPGFDPWVGKIPWEGKGYPLQNSDLEITMDYGGLQRVRQDWVTFTFFHPQSTYFLLKFWALSFARQRSQRVLASPPQAILSCCSWYCSIDQCYFNTVPPISYYWSLTRRKLQ